MTDCTSRLSTFNERNEAGIDTHRDDIGTLLDRKNKRLRNEGSYTKGNNHYMEFVGKIDIVITLLEDGKINILRFSEEYKKAQITFQTKMDNGIVRSANNQNEVKIHNHVKKRKTIARLRQLREEKYGCDGSIWI